MVPQPEGAAGSLLSLGSHSQTRPGTQSPQLPSSSVLAAEGSTTPGLVPKTATCHPYLTSSGLPSSLPRCCRPRVQAKMLAMGLVLVGRP